LENIFNQKVLHSLEECATIQNENTKKGEK